MISAFGRRLTLRKILCFFILALSIFVLRPPPAHACGVSPARRTSYLHPGQTETWGITIYMEDNNGDGTYESTVSLQGLPHSELQWASLSSEEFVDTLTVTSTSSTATVPININDRTRYLPFGQNFFDVLHSCECFGGGCTAVISQAHITISPWAITGFAVSFSPTDMTDVLVVWDLFDEIDLSTLILLRMEHDPITLDNYLQAETVAELDPSATSYIIHDTDPCQEYYYAVYGTLDNLIRATSPSVPNSHFGPPMPFFLLDPVDNGTTESSIVTFTWENTEDPYPNDQVAYTLYLSDNLSFANPVVIEGVQSPYTYEQGIVSGQEYYWRMKATDTSCEFVTFGTDPVNVALNTFGSVASSDDPGYPCCAPGNAIDGNNGTYWSSSDHNIGAKLWVDFPAAMVVNRIRVLVRVWLSVPGYSTLRITDADEGILANVTGIPRSVVVQTDTGVIPVSTSRITLQIVDYSAGFSVNGFELEAYGRDSTFVVLLCGNGLVDAGEECDDGNTNDGDGCSATCTVEPGSKCTGEPSVCITDIPAVSDWGLIIMSLLILAGGTILISRRRATNQTACT